MNIHPKVAGSVGGAALGGSVATVLLAIVAAIFPHYTVSSDLSDAVTVICSVIVGSLIGYNTSSGSTPPTASA